MKEILKKVIFSSPLLRGLFVLAYKIGGRRPWSLGYSVFKYSLIRHYVETNYYAAASGKFPQNFGIGIDERVVEYPWFFSRLKDNHAVILDAGSSLNHYSILTLSALKNRRLYLSTLDCEGFHRLENCPSYIYEDLREMCYRDEFFDAVVSISTIEHIGMDNHLYTTDSTKRESDQLAYLKAIEEFRRVLKKDGTLFLTVPFGRYENHRWFQIFDSKMLRNIIDQFKPQTSSITFFKYFNNQWQFAKEQQCQDTEFFDIHTDRIAKGSTQAASGSVACLELVK